MKKIFLTLSTVALLSGIVAFRNANEKMNDILKQLGVSDATAKEYLFGNFNNGTLSYPYASAIKNLALGKRAEAVQEIGAFAKTYTESQEFIDQYKAERENSLPKPPDDLDTYVKKQIEQLEHDVKTSEEDMKSAQGDMKKLYEATIKMQKEQLRVLKNPNDPNFAMYAGKTKEMEAKEKKDYRQALIDFEKDHPANPKDLIKARLQEFLTLTGDINFDAQLVKSGGKMRFADPKLEAKSTDWKLCFRSGKETISAARAFAQQWLKELK
jgi:hypothetical protein